jgi:signal peptidase I
MGRFLRLPAVFANLILVIGLVVAWIFLAPTKVGGQASYVIIHGKSMEPKFHAGDLVLLRKAPSYQVGDIVTYWDESMAAYTIHRILEIKQDRFILQGDNNSWIDPVQPGYQEIIGKLWIHLPKVGRTMEWLRSPINFALIVALAGGILMTGMLVNPKRNRKKELVSFNPNGIVGISLYIFGILFFAFLALSVYAISRPVSISSEALLYEQEGLYSYSATGTPGIYDTDTVKTGQPIFPKLTCLLNVGFSYNLLGNQVQSMSGSHQLYARVINEQSGWSRTIPMSQATNFSGTSFFNTGMIDLCQVEALVTTLEQETGLRSSAYKMEIVSAVTVMGNIAGETIADTFAPILTFRFDEAHFYVDPGQKDENVFHSSKPGMSSNATTQANVLSLAGLEMKVQTARVVALTGLFISLCCLLAAGLYIYSTVQNDQEALIQLKYGTLLVDVYEGSYEPAPPVIDVTSIDNLAKMAERHSTMILHIARDFLHDYLVQGNRATYRYSMSTGINKMNAQKPVQQEAFGMAWNASQSQVTNTRQPYQDLQDWGEDLPACGLEDTQPMKIEQRNYENSTYHHNGVNDESDQTMFLRKIRF